MANKNNIVKAESASLMPLENIENLMKERAFEFCGEYIRKYDLMRWGVLQTKLVEANNRLQNLAAHTGETAYVIDSIWGLNKGELGEPATYDISNGWKRTCIYKSNEESVFNSYKLFEHPETVESRQYWPIFPSNLQNSNGNLWNDYSY